MKLKIMLNGSLVVDLWPSPEGEVFSLGRDIPPGEVPKVLARAASLMRNQLRDRGDDRLDVDADLERLAAPGLDPRSANKVLPGAVYAMGEQLCPAGEETLVIEIGATPRHN